MEAIGVAAGLVASALVLALTVGIGRILSRRADDRRRAIETAAMGQLIERWGPDDRAEVDEATRLTRAFAECSVIWPAIPDRVALSVRSAAEALAVGIDSPALRVLAGLSERHNDEAEVRQLLGTVLAELGVATVDPRGVEAALLILRRLATNWLDGDGDLRELTRFVYSIGHETGDHWTDSTWVALLSPLAQLDDRLDWQPVEARRDAREIIGRFLEQTAGLKPTR